MRLSTCLLPVHTGPEVAAAWRRAEDLGFHAAYTYDHLNWREPFRDGPWGDAFLTLATAAAVTERVRLGTLVTTPNFRHPVTLAKEVATLDDLSGGRFVLGLGAGTDGFDAAILGSPPLTPRRRQDRFEELVGQLDALLTTSPTTLTGEWFSAVEARTLPQSRQMPRVPFAVAGGGPRGQRLAVSHGQAWVSVGDDAVYRAGGDAAAMRAAVAAQVTRLEEYCAEAGRDPGSIERILLTGFTPDDITSSPAAFAEAAHAYREAGITEIVVHAPLPGTMFAMDEAVYEGIAGLAGELAGELAGPEGQPVETARD